MNRPLPPSPSNLGALGERLLRNAANPSAEYDFSAEGVWRAMIARMRLAPSDDRDRALFKAQGPLGLSDAEMIATALACRIESEPLFAGEIAAMQAPGATGRLTFGLLARGLGLDPEGLIALAGGAAVTSGLLLRGEEDLPLPGRSLSMPPSIAGALLRQTTVTGVPLALDPAEVVLAQSQIDQLTELAQWSQAGRKRLLVLRGSGPNELRAAACVVARAIGQKAVKCSPQEPLPTAWLVLANAVPVIEPNCREGETEPPELRNFGGPIVCIADEETQCGNPNGPVREWRATVPALDERVALWRAHGLGKDLASRAARRYRQGAGSIAQISQRVPDLETLKKIKPLAEQVILGNDDLDTLARRSPTRQISDDALILPRELTAQIDRLRYRILERESLANDLGPAVTARYRPGVRALMTGESGTGKTLAAHWLAARMGLPLYRADMAALTSKWIGETEKNLSQLLSLAETTNCILFFDEADALFGARTDVSDSNDRHANAQTNFLLQRIEDFDGIAILSTNSRDRFDTAFVRRLDAILEFPLPDASARAALWRAHLGPNHRLPDGAIEKLAQSVELAGGHIRNAVLGAALRAKLEGETIELRHIHASIVDECDKLSLPRPSVLG